MTAKEMFEKLGYEYIDTKFGPYYQDDRNISKGEFKEISFIEKDDVCYHTVKASYGNGIPKDITMDELNAINKQCEELGWLEEEKQETNLEHYKDEIKYAGYEFALVNGKPTTCRNSLCDQCYFNDKRFTCARKRMEWMLKTFKRKYQLNQFEYDLLQSYANGYKFKDIMPLIVMKEKGYFKDVDKDAKIEDILENCEVIK